MKHLGMALNTPAPAGGEMNKRSGMTAWVHLLAAALLAGNASAQERPRGAPAPPPLTPEERAARREQEETDMAAWLPRLVGRFKVEGVVSTGGAEGPRSATGKVDCIAIGAGSGVQCVLYVTWDEAWGQNGQAVTAGVPYLGPAATLFGLDPNALRIRYMQLDTDGLVTDGAGQLNGNTLAWKFEGYCPSEAQALCTQETRIYAPPHGRYLHTTIEISPLGQGSEGDSATIDLELQPIPREEEGTAPLNSGPARQPS